MGNQLSQPQKLQPEHLAEVPKVVLKENLGASQHHSRVLCPWHMGWSLPHRLHGLIGVVL